jgi:hypothetical protein
MLLRKRIAGFNNSTDSALRSVINLAIETASYTAIAAVMGGESSVVTLDRFDD